MPTNLFYKDRLLFLFLFYSFKNFSRLILSIKNEYKIKKKQISNKIIVKL
jgi:hypothetical protein